MPRQSIQFSIYPHWFLTKNAAISALLRLLCLLKYLEHFNGFKPCSFHTLDLVFVRKSEMHIRIALLFSRLRPENALETFTYLNAAVLKIFIIAHWTG